jgi:CheY-like chemotaxis protein
MASVVLIVEDHSDTADLYREYLEHYGHTVLHARNGVDGIALAVTRLPDAIVMDLALPLLDGMAAIRQLRDNSATAHVPIIAVSGGAGPRTKSDAIAAGASAFLPKPCLPEDLLIAIRRHLPAKMAL